MLFKALCFSYQLWEIAPEKHRPGRVEHTVGWPLVSGASRLNEFFLVFIYLQASKVLTSQVQNSNMKETKGWKRPPELCSSFVQNCCFALCVLFSSLLPEWLWSVCLKSGRLWTVSRSSKSVKKNMEQKGMVWLSPLTRKNKETTSLTVLKTDEFFLHNIDRGHDNLSYYISEHSEITLTLHCSAKHWVINCCLYPSICFFSHNFQFLHNRIKTRMEVHFYII